MLVDWIGAPQSALTVAAAKTNVKVVKWLLANMKEDEICKLDHTKSSALHCMIAGAARKKDQSEYGCLSTDGIEDETELIQIMLDNHTIKQLILDKVTDHHDYNPLHVAALHGQVRTFTLLLSLQTSRFAPLMLILAMILSYSHSVIHNFSAA